MQAFNEMHLIYTCLLFIVMVGLSYIAWRKKEAFDVLCALTVLSFVVVVFSINVEPDWQLLLAVLAVGLGVYLGLQQERKYMRYTNTLFLLAFIVMIYTAIPLKETADWLLHLVPVIIGISLAATMIKRKMESFDFTEVSA